MFFPFFGVSKGIIEKNNGKSSKEVYQACEY
jgi:hypothetical protein